MAIGNHHRTVGKNDEWHPSLPATIEKGQKGYSIVSLIKYLNAIDEDIFLNVGKKEKKKN